MARFQKLKISNYFTFLLRNGEFSGFSDDDGKNGRFYRFRRYSEVAPIESTFDISPQNAILTTKPPLFWWFWSKIDPADPPTPRNGRKWPKTTVLDLFQTFRGSPRFTCRCSPKGRYGSDKPSLRMTKILHYGRGRQRGCSTPRPTINPGRCASPIPVLLLRPTEIRESDAAGGPASG